MKTQTRKSIATRLIFVVLGLYSLVALVGIGSHFFLEYRYQKDLIIRDLSDIQRAFEGTVADSLWKMDQQALNAVVLGMLRIPTVIGVRISDADDRLTAIGGTVQGNERVEKRDVQINLLGLSTEGASAVAKEFGLRLFAHSFALKQKGPTNDFDLGKVTIYSSNLFIYRHLKLELLLLVLNVIFTFATFGIVLLWAVRHYLGRPLGELVQATEKVSLDNLDTFSISVDAPEGCELKAVENAFNTMVRKLDHALSLHRQAENDLRESKERYELAMNAAKDGLWDWDLITNDIYYSPGWKRMLGYDYDELPNDFSIWEKLTSPEDVQRSWEMQQELIDKKRDRFEIEFKMRHKDGHWVDILSRANVFFDPNEQAVRIVGTHVDVTERNRVAKALLENERFLETVVENIPNMIFVKDVEELRFVRLNRAGEELLGFSRNEMLGKNDYDFFQKKKQTSSPRKIGMS